jgi:glycosyltransferase involved in cell wall biosynthesis
VFLFPTERDEAAPVVLIEAMASGTPVVASRLGGIPEVIGDSGEAGILVESGDVEGLTRATTALLSDEGERERMGRAGRARVLAEYTVERMVERTVDVYQIAVKQWRGASRA